MIAARAYSPRHQVGRSCPHPAVSPAFAGPDDIEIILDAPGVEALDLRFLEAEADAWVDRSTWPASWRARAEREPPAAYSRSGQRLQRRTINWRNPRPAILGDEPYDTPFRDFGH